jgi:hypothetical protein
LQLTNGREEVYLNEGSEDEEGDDADYDTSESEVRIKETTVDLERVSFFQGLEGIGNE